MILPDPFCDSCGRVEDLAECLLPKTTAPARSKAGGAGTTRLRLCAWCVRSLGVLPSTPFAPTTPIPSGGPR